MSQLINKISPSLLSCDFGNLESEIRKCEKSNVDYLHVDVMDGHFVPNITIGPMFVKLLKNLTNIPLDCHLMISHPDKFLDDFIESGADLISVHTEVLPHLHRTLSYIKSNNVKAGIVLNPITPLEYAFEAAEYCDFILLMSVNPGFGGQKFINNLLKRATKLRNFLDDNNLNHVEIEVDGGVTLENVKEIQNSGVNIFVSGSGLFKGNFETNVASMKSILNS